MNRRILASAMVAALSLSATGSLYAAPLGSSSPTAASQPAKVKMIRFNVRNGAKSTLVLKAGDQEYTIEPGKSLAMNLQDGAEILVVSGTGQQAPGSVIAKVSNVLKGNTLVVS